MKGIILGLADQGKITFLQLVGRCSGRTGMIIADVHPRCFPDNINDCENNTSRLINEMVAICDKYLGQWVQLNLRLICDQIEDHKIYKN